MASRDVIVVVKRDALPSEKESLDILLVSTTGEYPVATYRDTDSVEAVFGPDGACPNAKIVRKATTLLNQGKTTLADDLISKFKIVGFAPPTPTVATDAEYVLTFASASLEQSVAADTTLYYRIGGEAVVDVTTTEITTTGAALAALFAGKTFKKGDVTYTAAVNDNVVTFTAGTAGCIDTVPAIVSVYSDEACSEEVTTDVPTAAFTNGVDSATAAENLVAAIKAFQDVDNDWYYLLTDRDEDEYVKALAAFAEDSEPTEAELGAGVEDHRKFYMGQTSNKEFEYSKARAAVIYTDSTYLSEEPDASYTGNVGPFYPKNVTWKFKQPQNGNASSSEMISLPDLTESERDALREQHVNFLTEEYKHQYVKDGVCLNGEFIDVVLGGDWIAKRIRDLLYDLLLSNANIDYSDAGFGFVATAVMQALEEAADSDHNIIAVDAETKSGIYTVVVPTFADATDEQKSNRIMPDITWEAQLAGAIHQVKTTGVLKVSL